MICLGVETSCDDTSLALVGDTGLLGQKSSSQAQVHALFGGVVPEIASREHARYLQPLFKALLEETKVKPEDIGLVAVARGPGLLGSLLVGGAFAKAFCLGQGARFLGVNHLHAHLLAVGLEHELAFPALGLLVSGGHTQLYRIDAPDRFTQLGRTLDDAAGEAFDKAGKQLGLPYPAGRIMDELACEGRVDARLFPRPYLDNDNLDFSFSGLKTAMTAYLAKHPGCTARWDAATGRVALPEGPERQELADVCASYTYAVVETLRVKTLRALESPEARGINSIILAGGVAANSMLREAMLALARENGKACLYPSPALCADNGAMIAYSGWVLGSLGYAHGLEMEAIPRGRRVPEDMILLRSA